MLERDRLLEPPEKLPVPFGLTREELSAWRLHQEEDPLKARRYPAGRFRFDVPSGEYASLYCKTTSDILWVE